MNKSSKITLLIAVLAFAVTSCNKENKASNNEEAYFAFVATKTVKLQIDFAFTADHRAYVEAYAEQPYALNEMLDYDLVEEHKPVMKGYTDPSGKLSLEICVPTTTTAIHVYSPDPLAPEYTVYKLEGDPSRTIASSNKSVNRQGAKASGFYSGWEKKPIHFVYQPKWNWDGMPENLVYGNFWLDALSSAIMEASLHKNKAVDLKYTGTSVLEMQKQSRITLRYISSREGRRNALAFYVYTGEKPTQEYVDEHLNLVFPHLNRAAVSPGAGLVLKYKKEDGTVTDIFPTGSKIGFVLLSDAWQSKEGTPALKKDCEFLYSDPIFNTYNANGVIHQAHMAAFYAGKNLVLAFEDSPYSLEKKQGSKQGDFCDNIFVIQSEPIEGLPTHIPAGEGGPQPQYRVELPQTGTLVFEDIWPYNGDYDMNDVALSYQLSDWMNQDYQMTGITGTFTFINSGAGYEDGFGFELSSVATSNIGSCKIESSYSCAGQGLDKSLDKATVMLFDAGIKVPNGTVFKVTIEFTSPVTQNGYRMAPYNSFITVDKFLEQNRKEVHLVNYAPTPKIDKTMLGYGKDLSEPGKGIYYVSAAQYPFALNVPMVNFVVPKEMENISKLYPYFDKWVSSKGAQCGDWYKYPKQ